MKRLVIAAVLAASVITAGMVYARGPMGGCGGAGCDNGGAVSGEQWQKFKSDSIELREQMMTKRFELEKENLKAAPDAARIASLETGITDLRMKIQELRSKAGLPTCGQDGPGSRRGGMMNRGPGAGCGNCP